MTRQEQMCDRTRRFALRGIRLVRHLPRTAEAEIIGKQLLRCMTSVGANYRAACRARSKAEFAAKVGLVEEEADESAYWMQLIIDAELLASERVGPLLQEATELTKIMACSRMTARGRGPGRDGQASQAIDNRQSSIGNPQ